MAEPTTWEDVADEEEAFELPLEAADLLPEEDDDYSQFLEEVSDPLGLKTAGSDYTGSRNASPELDPAREVFEPGKFLATVHKDTPMTKLREGYSHLAKRVESRQQQLNFLVQNNFHRFVGCKDTIDELYKDVLSTGNDNLIDIENLEKSLKDINKRATETFGRLIERQMEIDAIRSVLSILTRVKFRFIFQLPEVMEQDMAKKDYSKVVFQYKKVKVWLRDTNVTMFKQVLSQAEKTIQRLHDILFMSLNNPQTKLDVQEKTIRLLLSLGTHSEKDPAWHCLLVRHKRLCDLLKECDSHIAVLAPQESRSTLVIRRLSAVLSELLPDFWRLTLALFNGEYHKGLSLHERTKLEHELPILEAQFTDLIEEVMDIYARGVQKHYFGSDYTDEEVEAVRVSAPASATLMKKSLARRRNTRAHQTSEKRRRTRREGSLDSPLIESRSLPANSGNRGSSGSEREPESGKEKIKDRAASLRKKKIVVSGKGSGSRSNSPGLKRKERDNDKSKKQSDPSDLTSSNDDNKQREKGRGDNAGEKKLSENDGEPLLPSAVSRSWSDPGQDNDSSDDEDFKEGEFSDDRDKVEAVLKCIKTLSSINVPFQFLESVHKMLERILVSFVSNTFEWAFSELKTLHMIENYEIVDQATMTTALPSTFSSVVKTTLEELSGLTGEADEEIMRVIDGKFLECLNTYADNLHRLAFEESEKHALGILRSDSDDAHYDAQVLILLNNCQLGYKNIVPALIQSYCTYFARADPDRPQFRTTALLRQLEDMLLQRYVKAKVVILNAIVQRSLSLAGFHWNRSTPFPGIRDYMFELVAKLVAIHAELFRLSPLRVQHVLREIFESVFEAYERFIPLVGELSKYGQLQIAKELQVLRAVCEDLLDAGSLELVQEILASLGVDKDSEGYKDVPKDAARAATASVADALREAYVLMQCFTVPESPDSEDTDD